MLLAADRQSFLIRRQESVAQSQDLLSRVIREVEETVLPRRFELVAHGQVLADLIVSNRRLIDMIVSGRSVLPGTDGDMQVETAARAYATALRHLHAEHQGLSLRLAGRAEGVLNSRAACSAAHLAAANAAPRPGILLQSFLDRVKPEATGWIACFGGQLVMAQAQPPEIEKRLLRVAKTMTNAGDSQAALRRFDREVPTCSALPLSAALQVLCARDGADHVLAVLPATLIAGTLADWRALYRSE